MNYKRMYDIQLFKKVDSEDTHTFPRKMICLNDHLPPVIDTSYDHVYKYVGEDIV